MLLIYILWRCARGIFCRIEHNKGSKFGLFLEDESYFESITKSQMYYLSAVKCIKNGQEEKSVVVEVAGRAELNLEKWDNEDFTPHTRSYL